MENSRSIIAGLIVLVVVVLGIIFLTNRSDERVDVAERILETEPIEDEESIEVTDTADFDTTVGVNPTHTGSLEVSDEVSEEMPDASGTILGSVEDGTFFLAVTAEGLAENPEGVVYEGWLVERDPFSYVNVGEFVAAENNWILRYQTENEELAEYDYFVVTEEAEDAEGAPAGRFILEGEIEFEEDEEVAEEDGSRSEEETTEGEQGTEARTESNMFPTLNATVLVAGPSPLLAWNAEAYAQMHASGRIIVLYFTESDCEECTSEMENALLPAFQSLVRDDVVGMVVSLNASEAEEVVATSYAIEEANTKVVIGQDGKVLTSTSASWKTTDYLNSLE